MGTEYIEFLAMGSQTALLIAVFEAGMVTALRLKKRAVAEYITIRER
jgi:hypothetical protein